MKQNKESHSSTDGGSNSKASKPKAGSALSQLSLNHLSKMLLSLNVITSELTNEHKICLEFPSIDIDLKKNDDMGGSPLSNNHLSITSTLCTYDIKVNPLFKLYKSIGHKDLYSFDDFKILLQMFSAILSAFNDTLFHYDLSKSLFSLEEGTARLQLYSIDDSDTKQAYQERLDAMYAFLAGITDNHSRNLLFLLSVFSLFGDITYQSFTNETITKNLGVYNRIYVSDIKLFLLIHFHLAVILNTTIKKLSIDSFLTSANKKKEDKHSLSHSVPCLYFIDNYSNEPLLEGGFQHVLTASVIKYFLLPYIEASGLGYQFNATVLSYEALRWLSSRLQVKPDQIKFSKELMLRTEQFIDLINDYDINEFSLVFDHSFSPSTVSCILSPYQDIIVKSKLFNAETEKVSKVLMLPYEDYISELDMLLGVLKFNLKVKSAKNKHKSLSKNYSFHFSFNSFTVTIKKDLSIKDKHIRSIIVFLNQKHFSEDDLVSHLSRRGGLGLLYAELRKIMSEFQYFKKYSIGIRISQHKVANEQLQFYLGLIYLQLQHYLDKHSRSHKNVILYETDTISPQTTIAINSITKHKDKLPLFNKHIKKFELGFVGLLNQYASFLIECFDDIVIHYDSPEKKHSFNPRMLLRNFAENILVIITDAVQVDFIVYMHENTYSKDFHEKIMNWIQLIRLNPDIADLIRKITVIMNRQCLAEKDYYNTDAHLKRFLSEVNTLYVMDKECDLILQERKMVIFNRESDSGSNAFETFISIIRDCYDTMQYIMSNQLREYNNFGFVFNISRHLLQFKEGCMSVRKITAKGFTSLFDFDPFKADNSYPIINVMTGKAAHDFSFNNCLKLFYAHYLKMEVVSQANILHVLHSQILASIYSDITILLLKAKYYHTLKALLPQAMFANVVVYPIKLNKIELDANEPFNCKEMTLFAFENIKLNFYSKNDMGRMFSLLKTEKSLQSLKTNAKSHLKSKRRVMIDHLLTVIWVLNHRIRHKENRERIMMTIAKYLVNRSEALKEGSINQYLVHFNDVANEVRKFKKKAQKDDNIATPLMNHIAPGSSRKRKGSLALEDNLFGNDKDKDDKMKNRANSSLSNLKDTKKNKNCLIF